MHSNNYLHELASIIGTDNKGSFIYGSFVYEKSFERIGDIDIFVLLDGENKHNREIIDFHGKEIHKYSMSIDIINDDIFLQKYGDIHSCNFLGPVLIIKETEELKVLFSCARQEKIKETLKYLSVFGVPRLKPIGIIKGIYFFKGLVTPYSWKILPKMFSLADDIMIDKRTDEYIGLFDSMDSYLKKKGNSYEIIKQDDDNLITLFTQLQMNSMRFWKAYYETHDNDRHSCFKHGTKHIDHITMINDFFRDFTLSLDLKDD